MVEKRALDPPDLSVAELRKSRQWKTILLALTALGAFAGSFWSNFSTKSNNQDHEMSANQLARMTRIERKVDETVEAIASLVADTEDVRGQVSEVKRAVAKLERAATVTARQEERHAEIMDLLRELDKRGVKKR